MPTSPASTALSPEPSAFTNSATRYGSVAKVFHWSIALGIIVMIPLGIVATNLPYDTAEALARKATLFSLHKTIGVAIFFLALARIAWALSQPKPAPLHAERRLEHLAAEVVHWLLYSSLVLVPLSGWVHHAATDGFAAIWWPFGQNLPFVPKDPALADFAAGAHIVFERVLALSLLLHIAGAVKHHVLDRDDTLRRMWFGSSIATSTEVPYKRHTAWAAPGLAVGFWAAAFGIGSALGVFSHSADRPVTADLTQVESQWRVTEGALDISVRQFGQAVSGGFASWTADITFDDSEGIGDKGDVVVEIAIGSLTLGTVTDQAFGVDYFDVTQFPTARFEAPITLTEDGYQADGTLSLRGVVVPVALPFELEIEGIEARMRGSLVLDRRAFSIGDTMTEPAQLGFEVEVAIALTAVQSDE